MKTKALCWSAAGDVGDVFVGLFGRRNADSGELDNCKDKL